MNRKGAFQKFLETSPVILGEGAVIERLRRMPDIRLDEHVVNSALIYDDRGGVPWRRSAASTLPSAAATACRFCSPPPPGVPDAGASLPPGWPAAT
jgi:hypothetical protein